METSGSEGMGSERPLMTEPAEMLHVLDRVHGELHHLVGLIETTAIMIRYCKDHAIGLSMVPSAIVIGYMRDQGRMADAGKVQPAEVSKALQQFQTEVYGLLTPEQQTELQSAFQQWESAKVKRPSLSE